jgi:bifunctional non-homologous end joining protein LigD
MEKISLYFRQGSSDKIYQAAIEPKDNGYIVSFAYGRRGTTLTTGTKTQSPVEYAEAKVIFDKLIKEKTAKGYTPGADGTPYQHTEKTNSGILPQLLNAVDENQLAALLDDPDYLMQEKHNGRRLLVQKPGDKITGINKLGLVVGIATSLAEDLLVSDSDFIVDGEIVGEHYHVFDLLGLDEDDLRGRQYRERYLHLMNVIASFNHPHISLVESAHTPQQKRALFDRLRAENAEGVVFKRVDAPYTEGRPNSGGSQFKFQFRASASFIVGKVNGKRSVSLKLFDGTELVSVGNVTIPPNREIPSPDDVVEVRYLYAHRGGSVFQPVYLGKRDDVTPQECSVDQLKYKPELAEVAA